MSHAVSNELHCVTIAEKTFTTPARQKGFHEAGGNYAKATRIGTDQD
jgi:hypothetical protein